MINTAIPLRMNLSDRLIALRRLDRVRKWESLDDVRFCRCCRKFISGRQIEVLKKDQLACPTENCASTCEDWVYPNEIAKPLNRWGHRALSRMRKAGVKLVPAPAV